MLQATNSSGTQPLVFQGCIEKYAILQNLEVQNGPLHLNICICIDGCGQIFPKVAVDLNNSPQENPQKKKHRVKLLKESQRLHHSFPGFFWRQKGRLQNPTRRKFHYSSGLQLQPKIHPTPGWEQVLLQRFHPKTREIRKERHLPSTMNSQRCTKRRVRCIFQLFLCFFNGGCLFLPGMEIFIIMAVYYNLHILG